MAFQSGAFQTDAFQPAAVQAVAFQPGAFQADAFQPAAVQAVAFQPGAFQADAFQTEDALPAEALPGGAFLPEERQQYRRARRLRETIERVARRERAPKTAAQQARRVVERSQPEARDLLADAINSVPLPVPDYAPGAAVLRDMVVAAAQAAREADDEEVLLLASI